MIDRRDRKASLRDEVQGGWWGREMRSDQPAKFLLSRNLIIFAPLFSPASVPSLLNHTHYNFFHQYEPPMPKVTFYLIRHGETVDNIAGLYAGVRDSALTNHGVEQAKRLGSHFSRQDIKLTHIFSSPLQRTCKTAEAVRSAQPKGRNEAELEIKKVPELIEQDFGFYEGKPFYARSAWIPRKSGKDAHRERHWDEPGFVDVESKESMTKRADTFLDQHLLPLVDAERQEDLLVAVVSHGMLLSSLWKRLLLRLPKRSLSIAPEVTAAKEEIILEHLGGWSNTGYLELLLQTSSRPASSKTKQVEVSLVATDSPKVEGSASTSTATKSAALEQSNATLPSEASVVLEMAAPTPIIAEVEEVDQPAPAPRPPHVLHGWSTTIVGVDSKQHLVGLKRQRGGIGRLAHDKGQKKLDSFFKRQRTS